MARTVAWVLAVLLLSASGLLTAAPAMAQTVTLSATPNEIAEDGGLSTIRVTARLSEARTVSTTISLSLGGSAAASDYTAGALPSITIPAGATDSTGATGFTVTPVDDSFFEGDETIVVNGAAGDLTVTAASLTLKDNETKPTLTLASTAGRVVLAEGGSAVTTSFSLTLHGASFESDLSVEIEDAVPADSIADPGTDYTANPTLPLTVTIPAGRFTATSPSVTFQAIDDTIFEGSEAAELAAKTTTPVALATQAQQLIAIEDNDAPGYRVFLELSPSRIPADGNATTVTFSVRVADPLPENAEVTVTPNRRGSWFQPGTLTIPVAATETPGARATGTFTVTPDPDQMMMDTETIGFTASYAPEGASGGASITPTPSTLTVYDPSGPPILTSFFQAGTTRSTPVFLRGDSFGFEAEFDRPFDLAADTDSKLTIELDSGPRDVPCTFSQRRFRCRYSVRQGDYDGDGVVAVKAGALNFSWSAPVGANWPSEPAVPPSRRTFNLAPIYGGTDGVDLYVTPASIQESPRATQVTVRAVSTAGVPRMYPIEIPLRFTDVTTSPSDYRTDLPKTITIPKGELEAVTTLTVTAVEDYVKEDRVEIVRLESTGSVFARGTLRILDAPTIALTVTPAELGEGGGAQVVTVTAALAEAEDQPRPIATPIALTFAGTAGAGDYTVAGTQRVTIPAEARSASTRLTFTPVDDLLLEGDETIVLNGTTAGLAVEGATLTLADNETTPGVVLAVDDATLLESETDGSEVKITAALDQAVQVDADTVVTLELAGTATQGASGDYTAAWAPSNRQITIPARQRNGSSAVTVTLTPRQDSVAEGDESIVVEGRAVVQNPAMTGLAVKVATVTLQDDDIAAVRITPTALKFREGGSASYAVSLATQPTGNVAVGMTTALAGTDLTVNPASMTFTRDNWDQAQTVTVSAAADQDSEDDVVTLKHTASGGGYGSVTAPDVVVTVTDGDTLAFAVAVSPDEVAEAGGESTVTVSTVGGVTSREDQTITLALSGTATKGDDYTIAAESLTLKAGETSVSTKVTAVQDALDEGDETVIVTASHDGATVGSPQTITINDDDTAAFTVAASPDGVTEAGGESTITVSIASATFPEDRTIALALSGTATKGDDYTIAAESLTLKAGETSVSTKVTAVQDVIDEDDETVTVTASSGGSTVGSATFTITDDDAAPSGAIALSLNPTSAGETASATTVTVTATLPGSTTRSADTAITVKVGDSADAATEGTDYATVDDVTLTISAGSRTGTKTFSIDPTQDAIDEGTGESLSVSGTTAVTGLSVTGATFTITDDDATPTVSLTLTPASVSENGGKSTVTASLSGASSAKLTVAVAAAAVSPAQSADFTLSTNKTLTIAAGSTASTGEVTITAVNNDRDAPNKSVTVSGTASGGHGVANPASKTLTITDDDTVGLVLSKESVTVTEASGSGRTASYTVKLATQPTAAVSVAVATADATAATVTPASLSFTTANWADGQTVTVTGVDDAIDNTPDRTATISHTASGGDYASVSKSLTATVTDDEGTSTFSVEDKSVTEGDSGTADLVFTVSLSPAADMQTTVAWATSKETADTATPGTDYTAASGTLTFAKGDTSKTITVSVTGDQLDEANETLTLTLSNNSADTALNAAKTTATGTITDDDTKGLVFTPTSVTVTEASGSGRTATYTVKLATQPTAAVSVAVATADATAATVTPASLSFTTANWADGQTVTVTGVDDALDNTPDRTTEIGHTASGGDYASVTGKVPVTVTDDEGSSSFAIGDASVTEGDSGTADLSFTVTLSPAADMTTTVAWATSTAQGDTATAGTDYTAASGTLSFAKGDTSKTVTVKVTGDEVDEANETLTVTLSNASDSLAIGDATATGTITDDDTKGLVFTPTSVTVTEASGSGRTATYTVKLATQPTAAVAVAVASDTASAATVAPASLSFTTTNWADGQTVTVTGVDDAIDNTPDRTATISHRASGGDYASLSKDLTATVTDDEGTASFSVGDASVAEGDTGTASLSFTVSLSPAADMQTTVDWATSKETADTATPGTDYTAGSGTLTFAKGDTSKTVTVAVTGDVLDEPNETLTLTLSNASTDTEIGDATATGTITDDDAAPSGITLTADPDSVTENGGGKTVTVTAAVNGTTRYVDAKTVTVAVGKSGDTATEGTDYASVADLTIEIAAGAASGTKTFTLTPTNDVVNEANETISVEGTSSGLTVTGDTITITDDDAAPSGAIALSLNPTSAGEAASATTVTVTATLPGSTTRSADTAITVKIGDSADAATEGTDYATVDDVTLTIAAGSRTGTKTFSIDPTQDAIDEGTGESLSVSGTTAVSGLSVTGATFTITDDDLIPTVHLLVKPNPVTEGSHVSVEVCLRRASSRRRSGWVSHVPQGSVTIPVIVTRDTAEERDYGDYREGLPRRDGTWRYSIWILGVHQRSCGIVNFPTHRDDDTDDETFTVALGTLPAGYEAGNPSSETVTIEDSDKPYVPTVILQAGPNPVAEGERVGVSVILERTSASAVTVPLTVTRGTSEDGDHGTLASITVPAGRCCATGLIGTTVDGDGDDETFTVAVDADNVPSGYRTDARSSVEIAIADDGVIRGRGAVPTVSLSASPNPVREGADVRVTATLSAPAARDVTVPLTVTRGTSEDGDHGTLASLFVPAGGLSATGTIRTYPDYGPHDETFTVALGTLPGDLRAGSPSSVEVTIADPQVARQQGDPGGNAADGTLLGRCAAHLPANAVSVAEVRGWRDAHAHDASHVERWNRVILALGEVDDPYATPMTAAESRANERRYMPGRWSRVTGTLAGIETCLAAEDRELPATTPEVSIAAGNAVTEGEGATFTVTASPAPAAALTVAVTVTESGGYATAGTRQVTVSTGGTATFTVATVDDGADEPDGSVTATLAAGPGYTVSSSQAAATVAVADDDTPVVTVSAGSAVTEGAPASFTLTAEPAPAADLAVAVSVAQRGEFIEASALGARTVTIPAGAASIAFTVATVDDTADEPDGAVVATLAAGTGYMVSSSQGAATVAVADDDIPVVAVAAGSAVTEGAPAGFTLTAEPAPAADLAVAVSIAQRGEFAEASALGARTVTIPAGRTSAAFTVATVDDAADELDGAVVATLGSGAGYTVGAAASARVSVADDDIPVVTVAGGGAVTEGAPAGFTLTAEPAPAADLAVAVSIAQRGEFAEASALGARTVTIPAGRTSAAFTVATVNDAAHEPDGSVTATLSGGAGYTVSSSQGTATVAVADDDTPVVTVAGGGAVTEGAPAGFTLTAEPAPPADLAVAVSIAQSGEFAQASALGARTVTIPAGRTSAAFTVATVDDVADEPDGAIVATLGSGAGYTVGDPGSATVAVTDNDEPLPGILTKRSIAREGSDDAVVFTVRLDRAAPETVTVDYATADGARVWASTPPATAGVDYTATSGTLAFAPGETWKSVAVPILDDALDEGTEYFLLRFSNPQGATLAARYRETQGLIRNDDHLQAMWLARFGRTVGTQVTDAVAERLAGDLSPGARATLAGQPLELSDADYGQGPAETMTGLPRRFGALGTPAVDGDGDPFVRHGLIDPWNGPATSTAARSMTDRELLLGSSFHVSGTGGSFGTRFAAWGRVVHGSFDGEHADGTGRTRVDGEALTGVLGADADFGRLLTGVAVSLSEGDGSFDNAGADIGGKGSIESTMTTVSPYARFRATDRVTAWGLAGWGTGDMTIRFDDGSMAPVRTDLSMQLGAIGARGEVLRQGEAGGMDLALRADAFFVQIESEKAANSAETAADASRLRLALEAGRSFDLGGGTTVRPSLELGVRHDGGDAETGTGVEVGGGVAFADADSGLSIEARARILVAHADSEYREWGASATARLDPGERGRGLSFSLSPTIGASSSAAERLWGARDARALAPDAEGFEASRGLKGEAGYGMALFGDRFTGTPNLGFGMSDAGARDYRLGWRLTSAVRGNPGFEVNLDAVRREAANDNAVEHGVTLRALVRW